jgi:hypothetical protein
MCGVSRWTIRRDLIDLQLEPLYVPLVVLDDNRWAIMASDMC